MAPSLTYVCKIRYAVFCVIYAFLVKNHIYLIKTHSSVVSFSFRALHTSELQKRNFAIGTNSIRITAVSFILAQMFNNFFTFDTK